MFIFKKPHVFFVLEYPKSKGSVIINGESTHLYSDPYIHGVYSTREIADNKVAKLKYRYGSGLGYVAVLKKTIEGPRVRYESVFEGKSLIVVKPQRS
jgi:hypothetical protein